MSLLEDLNWRYATKKMNGETVPQDKVDYIVEAARLAPSSSGLQPYRLFVISNKELLEKVNANLIGVVLNKIPTRGRSYYDYSYYQYEDYYEDNNKLFYYRIPGIYKRTRKEQSV